MDFPLDRKDGGKNRFGGRKSGVPEAKGRKCFKRAGVAVGFSNMELIGVLGKSSFGGMTLSLTARLLHRGAEDGLEATRSVEDKPWPGGRSCMRQKTATGGGAAEKAVSSGRVGVS